MSLDYEVRDHLDQLRNSLMKLSAERNLAQDRVCDLEAERALSVDTRVSKRDGVIRDMVAELLRLGYDIPCDEDALPMGWTPPEDMRPDMAWRITQAEKERDFARAELENVKDELALAKEGSAT